MQRTSCSAGSRPVQLKFTFDLHESPEGRPPLKTGKGETAQHDKARSRVLVGGSGQCRGMGAICQAVVVPSCSMPVAQTGAVTLAHEGVAGGCFLASFHPHNKTSCLTTQR